MDENAPVPAGIVLPRNLRLFLAVWPDERGIEEIVEHVGCWALPQDCLRYGRRDWHVTLHFLGSVAMQRLADVANAIDLPIEPFDLLLDEPQVWPKGLAVLGARRVPAPLQDLHDRLGAALGGQGFALDERTYRPHVTLARRAASARVPRRFPVVGWPVRTFALVVSTGNSARRYELLREYGDPGLPAQPWSSNR